MLISLQLRFLLGSFESFDLRLWDGSWYFDWGRDIAERFFFPGIENGPLYTAYYSIFHLLFSDIYVIYYVHRVVMLILITVLLYLLLCRLSSPLIAALLGAYFLLLLEDGGVAEYANRSFVAIPVLIAFRLSLTTGFKRLVGVFLASLAAVLVRPEFAVALPVVLVGFVLIGHREGLFQSCSKMRRVGYLGTLALFALMSFGLLWRQTHDNDRSWLAFGQHFSLGVKERNPEISADPWLAWQWYLKEAFGDADSVSSAMTSNPGAFFEHVFFNLKLFVGAVDVALKPAYPIRSPIVGLLLTHTHFMALLTIAIGIYIFQRRRRKQETERFPIGLLCTISAMILPVIISSLVVRPSPHYMVTLKIVTLILIGWMTRGWIQRLSSRLQLLLIILSMGALSLSFPTPFDPPTRRMVVPTVAAIPEIPGNASYGLVADSAKSFCIYTNHKRCRPIEILWGGYDDFSRDLEQHIQEQNVRLVIKGARFHPERDKRWRSYFAQHREAWKIVETGTQFQILVRF